MNDRFQSIKLFFSFKFDIDIHVSFLVITASLLPYYLSVSFVVRNAASTISVSLRIQIYKREKEREKESIIGNHEKATFRK